MSKSGKHAARKPAAQRRATQVGAATLGIVLAGGGAFAASSWFVGLNSGSAGAAESASITNLTISAVASPSPANQLYPGANGDVVINVTNPNAFPVTITDVQLPAST